MKYKVETDLLDGINVNDEIKQISNGDYQVLKGKGEGLKHLDKEVVERNPTWFQPVEEEVKEATYWEWCSCVYRAGKSHSVKEVWVKDISNDEVMSIPKEELLDRGKQLTTSEIASALTNEAKRRGYPESVWKSNHPEYPGYVPVKSADEYGGDLFEYNEHEDILKCKGHTCYSQGDWAEPIEPTIEINGKKIEVKDGTVTIDCSDTIEQDMFKNFYAVVNKYDLNVSRNGEEINEQLQQIWDEMPTRTACRHFKGTITDVTFLNSNICRNE